MEPLVSSNRTGPVCWLAYRMLGSRTDAEDLVQDAYLRWHQSATEDIRSPVAFPVTMTTRLCLGRLRELKHEREQYFGALAARAHRR
jgi:RNA polymerase sigma-70 factor (ECF subfamily)